MKYDTAVVVAQSGAAVFTSTSGSGVKTKAYHYLFNNGEKSVFEGHSDFVNLRDSFVDTNEWDEADDMPGEVWRAELDTGEPVTVYLVKKDVM